MEIIISDRAQPVMSYQGWRWRLRGELLAGTRLPDRGNRASPDKYAKIGFQVDLLRDKEVPMSRGRERMYASRMLFEPVSAAADWASKIYEELMEYRGVNWDHVAYTSGAKWVEGKKSY